MTETDVLIAPLLDRLRQQVVEARARGERPTAIRVTAPAFAAILALKRFEVDRGIEPTIFGLSVVLSDAVAAVAAAADADGADPPMPRSPSRRPRGAVRAAGEVIDQRSTRTRADACSSSRTW